MLTAAASALWMFAISHGTAGAAIGNLSQHDSAVSPPPADHSNGPGAIITRVYVGRAKRLDDATVSTFLVDYPPGTSVVLHRMPSSG
jgi:hypothetical protein